MPRTAARHLRAILALPFTVTVIIPALLALLTEALNPGWGLAPPLNLLLIAAGLLLTGGGLLLVGWTVRLFAVKGGGTLAPWNAPQTLVMAGPYRHVRNPMISGVIGILLGEAALLGVPAVLGWAVCFAAANMIYIPLSEEPGLAARFGERYRTYCANVPAWLPRLRAWNPEAGQDDPATH